MISAARRHALAHAAQETGTASPAPGVAPARPEIGRAASEYRMQLIQLGEDLRRLSNLQSVERKIEAKREMIGKYLPWIDPALAAEHPAQDEIVTTMLVWSIDIADWPLARRLATHVLRHGLTLPERYRRTPGTLIAEEIAEFGLAPTATVDLGTLQAIDDLTTDHDMPDEVRAKLKKAIGIAFRARADAFDPNAAHAVAGGKAALLAGALANLQRALELDPKCGVKKMIETAQREAKKPQETAQ